MVPLTTVPSGRACIEATAHSPAQRCGVEGVLPPRPPSLRWPRVFGKRGLVIRSCDQQKVARRAARLIHRVLAVGVSTHDMHVTRIQTLPAHHHVHVADTSHFMDAQMIALLGSGTAYCDSRLFHFDYYKWITGCITMPLVINTLLFSIRFVLLSCEPVFALVMAMTRSQFILCLLLKQRRVMGEQTKH